MGIRSCAGVRLGGGTGLLLPVYTSELVPRSVGLSANGCKYSGGKGGVKSALEGGAYDGRSRKMGEAVARGTAGYLAAGIDGLEVVLVVVLVVNGDGTVDSVVLADTWASYAGTLRFVVAELCATLLKIAARFFSRAVWSRLKIGLLGPPSPLAEQTVKQDCTAIRANRRSSRIIGVITLDRTVSGEMIVNT